MKYIILLLAFISFNVSSQAQTMPGIGNNSVIIPNPVYFGTPGPFIAQDSIYVFGDSYTAPFGTTYPWLGYAQLLCSSFGWALYNGGVGGAVLESRTPVNPNNMVNWISLLPFHTSRSKWLIIALGFNDVMNSSVGTYTPANFITDYTTVLDSLFANRGNWNPDSVLLIAPWYRTPTSYPAGISVARMDSFIVSTQTVATTFGCRFLNPDTLTAQHGGYTLMYQDSTHPNNEGHRYLSYWVANRLGYNVRQNGQNLATNGTTELNRVIIRNVDTSGHNNYDIAIDSSGRLVKVPNQYIRVSTDTGAYIQGGSISISGAIKTLQGLQVNRNGNVVGSFSVGGYFNVYNTYNSFPAIRTGIYILGAGNQAYIDVYDTTRTNGALPLAIQTQSHGSINFGGNVIMNSNDTIKAGIVTFTNYMNILGGSYPATKLGLLGVAQLTESYFDAYSTTTAGSGVTLGLNVNNSAPIALGGNTTVAGNRSFTVGTGQTIVNGGLQIAAGNLYTTKNGINFAANATIDYIDAYSSTIANNTDTLRLNGNSLGLVQVGGSICPMTDSTKSSGTLSNRWDTIYAALPAYSSGVYNSVLVLNQTNKDIEKVLLTSLPFAPTSGSANYINQGTSPVNQSANLGTGQLLAGQIETTGGGAFITSNVQQTGIIVIGGRTTTNLIQTGNNLSDSAGAVVTGGLGTGGAVAHGFWTTITSGTSSTAPNNSSNVLFNPSSLIASYTFTLPPNPYDGQLENIYFGGTIAGGSTVVTALTISPNSGQTIEQQTPVTTGVGGSVYKYKYNLSLTKWFRDQ